MATKDLDAILQTIRDVEASLEHRTRRALGVNLMIWGLASGSIFAFYQLAAWNHDAYHAALGPALPWVWLLPIALGYVASALVGVRLGRFGADGDARRQFRKALLPGALATVAATALILTGRFELVPGVLLVLLGAFLVLVTDRASALGRGCLALGIVQALAGIALLAADPPWTSMAAALAMGGGLLALGSWLFVTAR